MTKKIITLLLSLFIITSLIGTNTVLINAQDNETEAIDLKYNVTLKLDYEATYEYGDKFSIPEVALIEETDEEISILDVLVNYESTDEKGYNSSSFPNEIGSYKVTWTIKEDDVRYAGSGSTLFSILEASLDTIDARDILAFGYNKASDVPNKMWTSNLADKEYTGKAITLTTDELRVYDHTKLLTYNTDYTVKYSNNTKVGVATLTITGKGNYAFSLVKTFNITQKNVTLNSIADVYLVYSAKGVSVAAPKVSFGKTNLKNKTDYTYTIDGEQATKLYTVGEYVVEINPVSTGNYTFEPMTYHIYVQDSTNKYKIASAKLVNFKSSLTATGGEVIQDGLSLTYKVGKENKTLVKGEDYEITYLNNKDAGTATMLVVGKGEYYGSLTKTYKIVGTALSKVSFYYNGQTFKSLSMPYTGEVITPNLELKDSLGNLVLNKDYTVEYTNNLKAGNASITYTGIGKYSGSVKKSFKISALPVTSSNLNTLDLEETYTYLKGGVKPNPTIEVNDKVLTLNTDYTLSYKNNSITFKFKGNYSGSVTKSFNIEKADISKLKVTIPDMVVSTKANQYKAVPTITDKDGKALKSGTDYNKTIKYTYSSGTVVKNAKTGAKEYRMGGDAVLDSDIIPVNTTLKATITGINNYSGELTKTFRIVKQSLAKVKFKINPQEYTGKPICLDKSDIIVTSKEGLTASDYQIIAYSNNTNKGSATVTIKGVGDYGGIATIKFNIVAKTVKD